MKRTLLVLCAVLATTFSSLRAEDAPAEANPAEEAKQLQNQIRECRKEMAGLQRNLVKDETVKESQQAWIEARKAYDELLKTIPEVVEAQKKIDAAKAAMDAAVREKLMADPRGGVLLKQMEEAEAKLKEIHESMKKDRAAQEQAKKAAREGKGDRDNGKALREKRERKPKGGVPPEPGEGAE